MATNIENILIDSDATLRMVMEVIDTAPHKGSAPGIALVVNESKKLLGVVTDGDLRRAILTGSTLDSPVEKIMNRDPITVNINLSSSKMLDDISTKVREISAQRKGKFKIDQVVIVDDSNCVIDVVSFFDIWRRSELKSRQIAVIGLGYVGLTLAVSMADVGYKVIGVDSDRSVVEKLNSKIPHIHEVGLESILNFHLGKNLRISSTVAKEESDVYTIAVQTPINKEGEPVLSHIEGAARYVGEMLKIDDLVIVRSTVPVGATRKNILPILEEKSGLTGGTDFSLAMAPERTTAGHALKELRELPQIIGGLDTNSSELATTLFKRLTPTIVNVEALEVAELIKLIDNTYRDLTFAYSNEIALICDKFGFDAFGIIRAANEAYPRNRIPVPSPGVGGVCLTKDPYILMHASRAIGYDPMLIQTARKVNESMIDHVISKIENFSQFHGKRFDGMKIFIIGFAFKGIPETSDTRDSSTLDLVSKLLPLKSKLYGYDPIVPKDRIADLSVIPVSIENGFKGADCVLIMNNHQSYNNLDIYPLLTSMNKPAYFFDGWNVFSKDTIGMVPSIVYGTISSL